MNTLDVLDEEEFKTVLDDFETEFKDFSKAKTDSQFKSIVNSMHSSCDEIVRVVLGDNSKGFRNVINEKNNGQEYKKIRLNKNQKNIFGNLKKWMDILKHGSKKDIDRDEIEMVVGVTASFLKFVAAKHNKS